MTFEELKELAVKVKDETSRKVATRIVLKYGISLDDVPPESYDSLERDLRLALTEVPEREAMQNVLIAFKAFWQTTPGQQAETMAAEKLVDAIYDFRLKAR